MPSFDGHEFGWDFEDHRARTDPRTGRPFRGGTDLKHKRGENVKAYVTGRVSAVTRTSVTITPPSGNRTLILELGTVLVSVGDQVHPATVIGRAGLKWPHYNDLLPAGVHVRAAFLTPAPVSIRRTTMTTNYVHADSGDLAGGEGSLWALAGDAGTPCAGNWIEYRRTPADGSVRDRGSRMATAHGPGIFLTAAEWAEYKLSYTTPVASSGISLKPVLDAIGKVPTASQNATATADLIAERGRA